MPSLSKKSKAILETCHSDIQRVMNEAIKYFDFTVLEGHRGEAAQNAAFAAGKSKLKYPFGKHNNLPSLAVDIAPYPIDWKNRERFIYLAGVVMGIASQMNIKLRWGGDWNGDTEVADNKFDDLPHFELLTK